MVGSNPSALPWTSLQAFEAASRLASFKDAARELAVTPTAVSHQIRRLEAQLGFPLFERLHRSVQLTARGEVLASEVQDTFGRLHRSLARLRLEGRAAGSDTLTVSVVPSFASKWLAPRLHEFQALHPRIGLRIVADEALVDLRRARLVDVALRYGPGGGYGKALHAQRLWATGEIVAVCAPALIRAAPIRSAADVKRHMLIRTAPPALSRRAKARQPGTDWLAWLNAAGVATDAAIEKKVMAGPLFSASQLAIEAALAGQGIALAPKILVERDLASRRLKQLFSVGIPDPNAFWVLCRADRVRESRVRIFMRWLGDEASKSPPGG
jgi:LysR family glycine cleavage system transcriptional activator